MPVITVHLQNSIQPLLLKLHSAVFCGRCKEALPRLPFKEGLAAQLQRAWPAGSPSVSFSRICLSCREPPCLKLYASWGRLLPVQRVGHFNLTQDTLWWAPLTLQLSPKLAEDSVNLSSSSTSSSGQSCSYPFLMKIPIFISVSASQKHNLWQDFCHISQKYTNLDSMG